MNHDRNSGAKPRRNKSCLPNWQVIVLWIFVAASFAALFLAGYAIWAKFQSQ